MTGKEGEEVHCMFDVGPFGARLGGCVALEHNSTFHDKKEKIISPSKTFERWPAWSLLDPLEGFFCCLENGGGLQQIIVSPANDTVRC